jgi:hypothetical protein
VLDRLAWLSQMLRNRIDKYKYMELFRKILVYELRKSYFGDP